MTTSGYQNMSEKSLRVLRSIKVLRMNKLEGIQRGWFQEQELRKLRAQLERIDVLLRMWADMERLF